MSQQYQVTLNGSGVPIPKFKIVNTRTCLQLGSNFFVSLNTINEDIAEGSIHTEMCKSDFWVNG